MKFCLKGQLLLIRKSLILGVVLFYIKPLFCQTQSIANLWMETALQAICLEEGRPTIHARNLFHLSIAMYDAWAVFDDKAETYILGKNLHGFNCTFDPGVLPKKINRDSAVNICLSYAAYRLLYERFNLYSTKGRTIDIILATAEKLGLDQNYRSTNYQDGSIAALGNYIATSILDYGQQDGSNEEDQYDYGNYVPVNSPMQPHLPGNPGLRFPNRWQPLDVSKYVDVRGLDADLHDYNLVPVVNQGDFLSPGWGEVQPFALRLNERIEKVRDGIPFHLYLDPGPPPLLDYGQDKLASEAYKWGFLLVALWSSHLDPADSVKWNISPRIRGNSEELPASIYEFPSYYKQFEGGTWAKGHRRNPITAKPYEDNWVPRGDYTRVIAEFWVDGVNTVTPPGHWFKTLNYVSRHPQFEKKWKGKGPLLDPLVWDIKSYFVLAGAMHDAAIAAWGVKAYYDYVRPISAIRMMADRGQCTDPELPNYHIEGLPLIEGFIEVVKKGDELAGSQNEDVGKLKMYTWRGPEYIHDSMKDRAGVGWILAENWWPYQRYSLATPPFAGYVSGHSTFSTAAAEVLTQITGNPFFPGGLAEFRAKEKEFLMFEDGPSKDLTLQWATYEDAAYETCLSRIWGGIHPPADDIAGRKMGKEIGHLAIKLADTYFR
ncbi:MAG: vanadium-dependent haloperoxidase [Bacteroidota bacterium]